MSGNVDLTAREMARLREINDRVCVHFSIYPATMQRLLFLGLIERQGRKWSASGRIINSGFAYMTAAGRAVMDTKNGVFP